MVGLFHVALLAGLGAVGRDVSMQVASVERGALNGIFKSCRLSDQINLLKINQIIVRRGLFSVLRPPFWWQKSGFKEDR